jgi:four helix bundle protein
VGGAMTFEDLEVWQRSRNLNTEIYAHCRAGELARDFGLRNQLQRASVSIMTNIAEGYERNSRKEYIQFLGIAKGSAGETRSLIWTATDLGYIDGETAEGLIEELMQISRMIKGLMNSLRRGLAK